MKSKRLLLFISALIVCPSVPSWAIDITLEGGRKIVAQKVTFERGRFYLVSNGAKSDFHADAIKFIEADESNLQKEIESLNKELSSSQEEKKELETKLEKQREQISEFEAIRGGLEQEISSLKKENQEQQEKLILLGKELTRTTAEYLPPTNVIKISALKLYQEYEANEVAADAKYKDKILEVSGTIKRALKDHYGSSVVCIHQPDRMAGSIWCYFEVHPDVIEGQKITVRGTCSGRTFRGSRMPSNEIVVLDNCYLQLLETLVPERGQEQTRSHERSTELEPAHSSTHELIAALKKLAPVVKDAAPKSDQPHVLLVKVDKYHWDRIPFDVKEDIVAGAGYDWKTLYKKENRPNADIARMYVVDYYTNKTLGKFDVWGFKVY
jgi:hypothetical protein